MLTLSAFGLGFFVSIVLVSTLITLLECHPFRSSFHLLVRSHMSHLGQPGRLRILIVRHGETHENVAKIIQGQLDTPLNPHGHQQASHTALHLSRTTRIHRAISSPLQRARDTAHAIVSQQHPGAGPSGLELETDVRLMERAFGVLEGKVYTGPRNKREDTSGIEKMQPFVERLASFWNDLIVEGVRSSSRSERSDGADGEGDGDERTVLLVSHGAAISALLNEVLVAGQYVQLADGVVPSRLWNCSITEIVVPLVPDSRPPHEQTGTPLPRPGDLARKTQWTVRPPHLNVQGVQFLREFHALKRSLASETARLSAAAEGPDSEQAGQVAQRIRDLSRSVDKTESLFAKDRKMQARLEVDVLRGPDGQVVEADIGYGKGIGCVLRWADEAHLQELKRQVEFAGTNGGAAQKHDVNVDELVANGQ